MEIMPTTLQTYHQAVQVLSRAFVDDPVTLAVYRKYSVGRRIKALSSDFTNEMFVCIQKGYAFQANEGTRVIGAAMTYPPGTYPFPLWDQWLLLIKSILANGFYNIQGWMRWLAETEKHHPSEPHFYLLYIGVEPEFQGKSVGSALMKHLIEKADQDHIGCYLENSNRRNIPFYQRFGFQITLEKDVIGVPTWFMWRPPG